MQGEMTCAVFHGVEDIRIEKRPIPPCPEGGLLLKVMACGICGSDERNYHNGLKDGIVNQIMGHEIAGQVVETGVGQTRFRVGDALALAPDVSCGTCWYCKRGLVNLCTSHKMLGTHFPGGYAQYIALPPVVLEHGFVEPIPEGMKWSHAAFAETASAVIACQKRIGVGLGDHVVVIGDGPVGCLHVEVARARGAAKIMMLGMDKLELAKTFSPDLMLDNRRPLEAAEAIRQATNGIGVDFVICAVPVTEVQNQALRLCRKRGTVVIYGGVPASRALSSLDSNLIHYNELTVTGSFSYPAIGLHDAIQAIDTHKINAEAYISQILPLRRVTDGMKLIRSGAALKVILDPWLED